MLLVMVCLAGCVSLQNKVVMPDADASAGTMVKDATTPDTYPGFGLAEGNIYSCRYGIHHQSVEEFVPDKARIFSALLHQAAPGIDPRRVVLERFDVYYNYRLKALGHIGQDFGGIVGNELVRIGKINQHVFTFDRILIDMQPDQTRRPNENAVGCDDRQEGDYYASQISGGHDVVVTWLGFSVDGKKYLAKSYYQFQPEGKPQIAQGLQDAMRMTVAGVASRIAPAR